MRILIVLAVFLVISCGTKPVPPNPPIPIDPCEKANAGPSITIKKGDKIEIGLNHQIPGVTYRWLPESSVLSPRMAKTLVSPNATTVYLLLVKTSCGTTTSYVKVRVI